MSSKSFPKELLIVHCGCVCVLYAHLSVHIAHTQTLVSVYVINPD